MANQTINKVQINGNPETYDVEDAQARQGILDLTQKTNQLKEDIDDIVDGYIPLPIIPKSYVSSSGEILQDPNWSRTDYVRCTDCETLEFIGNTKKSTYNCFYDVDKNFISYFTLKIGDNKINVPVNAEYFIISNASLNIIDVKLKSYEVLRIKEIEQDITDLSEQVTNLENQVNNEEPITIEWIDGYYIDNVTGEKKADSSWKCSDYISIPSNTRKLIISTDYERLNPYNTFLDDSEQVISRIAINANAQKQEVEVPKGAKKFALSVVSSKNLTVAYKYSSEEMVVLSNRMDDIETNIDTYGWTVKRNYLPTIHSISRMGYSVGNGYPKESINAFMEAIKMGFDAIRCNYRVTLDGVPISLHDATINSTNARLKDGSAITSDVDVNTLTYDVINETYNFSKKGNDVYTITTFEDVVKLCKKTGTTLYVEMKIIPTNEQCDTLIRIVKQYGMEKYVQFIGYNPSQNSVDAIKYIADNSNVERVGIMCDSLNTTVIQRIGTINSSNVSVFIWGWNTMDLTEYVDDLVANNIEFEMGTVDTMDDIISYFDTDVNNYCIGVESNYVVASKVIVDSVLLN